MMQNQQLTSLKRLPISRRAGKIYPSSQQFAHFQPSLSPVSYSTVKTDPTTTHETIDLVIKFTNVSTQISLSKTSSEFIPY